MRQTRECVAEEHGTAGLRHETENEAGEDGARAVLRREGRRRKERSIPDQLGGEHGSVRGDDPAEGSGAVHL